MQTLFTSRAGFQIVGGGAFARADWPLGKVSLDREALTIASIFGTRRLLLADIDRIRPRLLCIQIQHHGVGVPERVHIWGIRLFRRLREAIQRHQLQVEVTE